MTLREIGLVYNYFLKHKVIRAYEKRDQRRSKQEKEVADIMELYSERLDDLAEFLETQGLAVRVLGAQEYKLANQGRAYVLLRCASSEIVPDHLNIDHIWMLFKDDRRQETKATTTIWTSYLYLHLLYFLYSADSRTIESISRYGDTWVEEEPFKDKVVMAIDQLRQQGHDKNYIETEIRKTLVDSTEKEVQSRINRFFKVLLRVGVLEIAKGDDFTLDANRSEKVVYRQTLWSAVDIAENFKRYASLLLNPPLEKDVYSLSKISE